MKTILAFSGGLNSGILLWEILGQGNHITCVFVDYGQLAADKEMMAVGRFMEKAEDRLGHGQELGMEVVRLENFPRSPIPPANLSRARDFAHFGPVVLAVCANIAIAENASEIALGCDHGSIVEGSWPCLARVFDQLHRDRFGLSVPFADLFKSRLLENHRQLRGWLAGSWSCLSNGDYHCGLCRACKARKAAFRDAGLRDFTQYASSPVPTCRD